MNKITVRVNVESSIEKVWNCFTKPEHIVNWNFASDDWHCPKAVNDLQAGKKFSWRMEAKDGSVGFDFEGVFDEIKKFEKIAYTLLDGRKVEINFNPNDNSVDVIETFDAETYHSIEQQRDGWQAILKNFKKYTESLGKLMKAEFIIEINAPVNVVFKTMLGLENKKTYEDWTAEFNPTSTYEGKWKEGEEIRFIGTDENGKKGGMISKVAELISNKLVSIQHIGILDGESIITSGPQVESWKGAFENYYLEEKNGKTLLTVKTDITEEFREYFENTWPKALHKLKEICEG
ncbi:MAG: SRPBCC domain-containing protein [Ignavibacterium sp.]|jgi:uncharacterized protein YndB with AHSA1/START domain|uniref:SRPBCC family protein n=1 Tax=Ignavibacterium sp. TaxID=2651167 RepID=UPI0032982CD3